jgi:hypothetical protein
MNLNQSTTPACPVSGCKAKTPHVNDSTVQAFMRQSPAEVIDWTKRCIVELVQSVIDDVNKGRMFAYLTRWRDPEELYTRVLYAMFVAPADHLPHIFSGDMPNGFAAMWRKVNEIVFEGNGMLFKEQVGLRGEVFTTMNTLNQNAHNSFSTMLTTISIVRSKPDEWHPRIKKHVEHWQKYVEYLNHIEQLFRAGRKKEDVLQAIINMHRSIKRWEEIAREQARNPVPAVKLLKTVSLSKGGRWRYLVVDQPPGEDLRFRVHIDERRYASKDNMVVIRTGTETEMLAAFDSDYQAALKEGWQLEGSQARELKPSEMPPAAELVISHEEIARHAYYHWERRGRPLGSPDVDWYWAIENLKRV